MANYFLIEINDKFAASKQIKEDDLERVELIVQKYLLCLKSQQNQNRVIYLINSFRRL